MKQLLFGSIVMFLLVGCGSDEPTYEELSKDALDKVSSDVEKASEEAKEKIDEAMKNLE